MNRNIENMKTNPKYWLLEQTVHYSRIMCNHYNKSFRLRQSGEKKNATTIRNQFILFTFTTQNRLNRQNKQQQWAGQTNVEWGKKIREIERERERVSEKRITHISKIFLQFIWKRIVLSRLNAIYKCCAVRRNKKELPHWKQQRKMAILYMC